MIAYNSTASIIVISAISAVIIALHLLSVFGGELLARISTVSNIALHALMVLPALLLTDPEGEAIELELIVLYYMLSLLVYTAAYFIRDAAEKRRARRALGTGEQSGGSDDV